MTGWNSNGQDLVLWPKDFLLTWSTLLATGAAGHSAQEWMPLEQPPNRAGQGVVYEHPGSLTPKTGHSQRHILHWLPELSEQV